MDDLPVAFLLWYLAAGAAFAAALLVLARRHPDWREARDLIASFEKNPLQRFSIISLFWLPMMVRAAVLALAMLREGDGDG